MGPRPLTEEARMADIAIQIDTTADPAAAYTALTTTEGVAGWGTTRNQTSGAVGEVDRMWFPDAPMAWELRVDEAVPGKVLAPPSARGPPPWLGAHAPLALSAAPPCPRTCGGGPPQWIGTDVRFALEPAPQGGTRILLDHTGFAQVDEMFRIVTLGWSQMLLQLKQYLDSGQPAPFFSFLPHHSAAVWVAARVGWPGGITPPGSPRTERDSLPSLR